MTADTPTSTRSTAVLACAAASVAAAMVHAAAAGTHAGAPELVRLFAVCAAAQAIVAGFVLVSPTRSSLLAMAGVNVAAVAAWGFSRTTGLPWPTLLEEVEEVGAQDLAAAVLGAAAALSAGIAIANPGWARAKAAPTAFAGVCCTALLALAVPGMTAEHTHGEGSHDHTHEGTSTEATNASATVDESVPHSHDEGTTDVTTAESDGHTHTDADGELAAGVAAGGGALPTGPVISLDDVRLTSVQRDAAADLIDVTTTAMEAFPDQAAIEAAGYVSIGDGVTGYEHFVNYTNLTDGADLDPDAIESIVMTVADDGTKTVASAMYILTPGMTMDDVPDIAGELTTWHDHQNLCWEGARVVGTTDATGSCQRGTFRPTPPMLHVWVPGQEPECGPFAGIEGSHGSSCASHEH